MAELSYTSIKGAPRRARLTRRRGHGITQRMAHRNNVILRYFRHVAADGDHAVIRLDGAQGPGDQPPPWASADLLRRAITAAATAASITLPSPVTAAP